MEAAVFYCAARGDVVQLVPLLLSDPSCANARNQDDDCPLHVAAANGQAVACEALLRYGANANIRGCSSRTPLVAALCERPNPACVAVLLERGGVGCLALDDSLDETVLHKAATVGDEQSCELVFRHGGSLARDIVNHPNVLGSTALHNAAHNGRLGIARFLLANGANPWQEDNFGYKPWETAAHRGHRQVAEFLRAAAPLPTVSVTPAGVNVPSNTFLYRPPDMV
eukprot:TRINITY_DN6359_c0_g1_i2.p1 TRINITY_DN6359_c0_g1~~TRINITY_DN6359_c0_g1_i2.p1  ORF type:complete len:226 (-),score=78.91 TRINITY_DN6359_c0_g1_i2:178-855(-)